MVGVWQVLAGIGVALSELGDIFGISDIVKGVSTYTKWKIFDTLYHRSFWANMFSSIEDAETSALVPVSPAGLCDISRAFTDSMCFIRTFIDPELAEELIGEMLSEGLSSAMETNVAGALQTYMNVWRGSLPADLSNVYEIGNLVDRIDYRHAQSVLATVGNNPFIILHSLIQSADSRYREKYSPFVQQYLQYIQAKVDYTLEIFGQLRSLLAECISRLMSVFVHKYDEMESYLQSIANEHLARLNQLHDNLETDWSLLSMGIISEDRAIGRFVRTKVQAENTKRTFLDWYNALINAMDTMYNEILAKVEDIANAIIEFISMGEDKFKKLLEKLKTAMDNDDDANYFANRILSWYKDLVAYRGVNMVYEVDNPDLTYA